MSKTKAPAFHLYANDLLSDTLTWTAQELGVHIRLLCWSWMNGPVPLDLKRIARIDACAPEVWGTVSPKWVETPDGWINKRLEEARAEQNAYRERQSERGKASARARASKGDTPIPTIDDEHPLSLRIEKFTIDVIISNNKRQGAPGTPTGPLPKNELDAFIAYWTQCADGARKFHAERQKAFEIPKRLALWASKVNWNKYQPSPAAAKSQASVMDRNAPIETKVNFKPTHP